MKMSDHMQEQYAECRIRMNALKKRFKWYLIGQVALGAILFFFAMFAGAATTLHENLHGPEKFYYAMNSGAIQIIMGIMSIVLGWITASKVRGTSFALLAGYGLMIVYNLVRGMELGFGNLLFLLCGFFLNLWIQSAFSEDLDLREKPGYPLFSVNADTHAEYEAPLYVTQHRGSGRMETVGDAARTKRTEKLQKPTTHAETPLTAAYQGEVPNPARPGYSGRAVSPENAVFAEMSGSTQHGMPRPVLEKPDIALEAFADHTAVQQREQAALDAQKAMQAAMLSDMTATPAHTHYAGDASMLPTPEEVRARMAAMKQERKGSDT